MAAHPDEPGVVPEDPPCMHVFVVAHHPQLDSVWYVQVEHVVYVGQLSAIGLGRRWQIGGNEGSRKAAMQTPNIDIFCLVTSLSSASLLFFVGPCTFCMCVLGQRICLTDQIFAQNSPEYVSSVNEDER